MQEAIVATYIALLRQYNQLLQQLYHALEPSIQLKGFVHHGVTFTPTKQTIQQQMQHWPEDRLLYPPVAWVEPRTGAFRFDRQEWTFAFHGIDLSFFQHTNALDVSGEFSKQGTLAFTAHTVWCYLTTHPMDAPSRATLVALHDACFKEMEERKIIMPIPLIFDEDEQGYHLNYSATGQE